jgi:DNA-binding transcriptional ArsR family regulator
MAFAGCHMIVTMICDYISGFLELLYIGRDRLSSGTRRAGMHRSGDAPGSAREVIAMPRSSLAVVGHVGPEAEGDRMSAPHALSALAALGQPTRLAIFRLLVQGEPAGQSAGAIAETIDCPRNTLSSHLGVLARAGLIRGKREGRSILYHADIRGMRRLVGFLVSDCCNGHPELCGLLEGASTSSACKAAPAGARKGRK